MNATQADIPEYYDFPPFFTLQPVLETRKMQMKLWQDFILSWHQARNVQNLCISEWPYFANARIKRSLSTLARQEVIQELVKTGHAEWKDPSRTICYVMWRSSQELAASILSFARKNGMAGSVYTVYDLHSGDEITAAADFHGTDPVLFHRALEVLEAQGNVAIFKGSTSDEDGVKFIAE